MNHKSSLSGYQIGSIDLYNGFRHTEIRKYFEINTKAILKFRERGSV